MDGRRDVIPEDGYLLVDISEVDKLGDGFSVCWSADSLNTWKIGLSNGTVIETKLDGKYFQYYQPVDESDLPISALFKETGCGIFMIREGRKPWGNLLVRYLEDG